MATADLAPGCAVRIRRLVTATRYNDCVGTLLSFDAKAERSTAPPEAMVKTYPAGRASDHLIFESLVFFESLACLRGDGKSAGMGNREMPVAYSSFLGDFRGSSSQVNDRSTF